MLNIRVKIILVFMIFLSYFLINTRYTDADIFAERMVLRNRFAMTALNFFARHSASNGDLSYLFRTIALEPGGFDIGAVRIQKQGDAPMKYHIKAVKTNGDDGLCNALTVQVMQRNLAIQYKGGLMSLNIDSSLQGGTAEDWIILTSLDDKNMALKNKICEFNIELKTYRSTPGESGGIFAQRILTNVISSGNW